MKQNLLYVRQLVGLYWAKYPLFFLLVIGLLFMIAFTFLYSVYHILF